MRGMNVILLPSDVASSNGTIYPREVLEKEVARINNSLSKEGAVEGIPGQWGYSSDPERFDLKRLSFYAKDLKVTDEGLTATIVVAKIQNGLELQQRIDEGDVSFRPLSSRAEWDDHDDGTKVVTNMKISYIAAIPKNTDAFSDAE
jgi:hypothetical protein